MKNEDKSIVLEVLRKHEIATLGVMVTFFSWIVIMLFSLKEAQAVSDSTVKEKMDTFDKRQDRMKEKVDKIYDYLITGKK